MKVIYFFILILSFLAVSNFANAHPGRTDSSGCHTCRTNCPDWGLNYGEYHCHNAKVLPQPEEPIHSVFGEDSTGYTIPALEYKSPESLETKKEIYSGDTTAPVATTPSPVSQQAPVAASVVTPSGNNAQSETGEDGVASVVGVGAIAGGGYLLYRRFKKNS
jgi:LPXTG-motif cell wall-anchored protein